jgi:hypothetical protein
VIPVSHRRGIEDTSKNVSSSTKIFTSSSPLVADFVPQLGPIAAFHLAVLVCQWTHRDLQRDALHGFVVCPAFPLKRSHLKQH